MYVFHKKSERRHPILPKYSTLYLQIINWQRPSNIDWCNFTISQEGLIQSSILQMGNQGRGKLKRHSRKFDY